MIAIGFLSGVYFMQRDAAKRGIDPRLIGDLAFWSLLLGVAGTRVLHIILFPEAYSWSDPVGWIAIWNGGLVFQGALPPVVLYGWYYVRKHKLGFWSTADMVMPYVALGHAFGRIGCFLNGCCYGHRTDLPWGIPFRRVPWDLSQTPVGSPPYLDHCARYSELSFAKDHWSYPVHPTQLYSALGLALICLLLLAIRKRCHPFDGLLLPLYFIFYGVGRFFIEFLRGDHNPTHFGGLSDQQMFCVAFALTGLTMLAGLVIWNRRGKTGAGGSTA
jgi:phosphatidylglycerol:prolipoprotein diacylglycerol transferase